MHGILLEGRHPTLPQAELEALLAVHGGTIREAPTSRVRLVAGGEEALRRCVQSWAWGDHWAAAKDSDAGIAALATSVPAHARGQGSIAVRGRRYGSDKSPRRMACERALGAALVDAGHTVDLDAPDQEIYAWLGAGRIHAGLLRAGRDALFQERIIERRAHFSPVGLHPRRAAGLVHLARVAPGGRILDPFCGTGGIVLEAALLGFEAWGSDIDPWMVQGTMTTLTDAGPEPLDATVFQSDIGAVPDQADRVDGIVTDLPYGGASSTHQEDLSRLYGRALDAFARMLVPGGRAVVGHAVPGLLGDASDHGFRVAERHEEYIHGSLTRHYAVLERV